MAKERAIREVIENEDGTKTYKRNSIPFYKTWWDTFKDLPPEEKIPYIEMILDYGLEGIKPDKNNPCRIHFHTIEYQIDSMNQNYEHGKDGRRPKGKGDPEEYDKPKLTGDPTRDANLTTIFNEVEKTKQK